MSEGLTARQVFSALSMSAQTIELRNTVWTGHGGYSDPEYTAEGIDLGVLTSALNRSLRAGEG